MKRLFALSLAILLLCGCTPAQPTSVSVSTPPVTEGSRGTSGLFVPELKLYEQGRVQVPYTIPVSSVSYITRAEDLPDREGLERFNAAFFEEHALLIVMESVKSGSVDVSIDKVTVENAKATVTLQHQPGAAHGNGVQTTWLLWAVVDRDLAYSWIVTNPAMQGNHATS